MMIRYEWCFATLNQGALFAMLNAQEAASFPANPGGRQGTQKAPNQQPSDWRHFLSLFV
jgi:hypothetical protein